MTQDKSRKEAVRSYATERNLSYTQALAVLEANATTTGRNHGTGILPAVRLDRGQGTDAHSPIAFIGPDGTNRPHAYIVGATGTGKTHLMRSLAHQVVQGQGIVKVCDPKAVGWADFVEQHQDESQPIEHATTLGSIAALIESTRNQMHRRISRAASQGIQDDTVPYLLILDEAQQILGLTSDDNGLQDNAVRQEALNNIQVILRQGRAVGIHLLIGSQRPIEALTSEELADNLATWTPVHPSLAIPRREGEVSFTDLSRTAIVTITAEEITARCGPAPANVAECAREWWEVAAEQQPRIERLIAILKDSSGLILGDWDVDPEAGYGPENNVFPFIDPAKDDIRKTKGKRLTGVQGQQGRIYSLDLR